MKTMKSKAKAKVENVDEAVTVATETPDTVEKVETQSNQVEDLIVSTVKEIEAMKEDKAFSMVPKLLDNIDHDYFRLGGVMAHIQSEGWFMDKGHENFRAYIENECGIAYRKSMYLIAIYNGLVASGVAWEDVRSIGWTKLKEIAAILTPENVKEWVSLAGDMTVLQLQDYIRAKSAGSESASSAEKSEVTEPKKVSTMTFKVHEDQKATIREALDKCKHESGTETDTVALEYICLDYLGGTPVLKSVPSLKDMMIGKSVEEVLEVLGEAFPDLEMEVKMPA